MVSKKKFKAFVEVQKSGVTNMVIISNVITAAKYMSGVKLSKEDCLFIMKNYKEMETKYAESSW